MQLIFQDPHASLNPAMTIRARRRPPAPDPRHRPGRRRQVPTLVSEALERVGLVPVERFLRKYPSDLSGGQKQRAVLARAIILGPELVIADEPVSMLDMSVRAKVLQLMGDLKSDLGLTYLYVTHDLATARYFCDRIAIMYLGRIVEIGSAAEIYARPASSRTRRRCSRRSPSRTRRHTCRATSPAARCPTPRSRRSAARSTRAARGRSGRAAGRAATCARCSRSAGRRSVPTSSTRERGDRRRVSTDSTRRRLRPSFPAGRGHSAAELAALLDEQRRSTPEDPFWRGVLSTEQQTHGVTVRFHDHVTPELQPVVDAVQPVEVACHLYRPDLAAP